MPYPIADAHCDYLFGAMEYGWNIHTGKRDQTMTLPNFRAGNVRLQFFAAWSDETLSLPPLVSVPLLAAATFILAYAAALLLRKLPVARDYLL